jgi:hypothetical protein
MLALPEPDRRPSKTRFVHVAFIQQGVSALLEDHMLEAVQEIHVPCEQ